MTRHISSNLEYNRIAWRKAFLQHAVYLMVNHYTSAHGDPPHRIYSEDVFKDEAEVPKELISDFLAEMNAEVDKLGNELKQFRITRAKHDEEQQAESGEPSPKGKADAGKHGHHRQGAAGKRPRPAEPQHPKAG